MEATCTSPAARGVAAHDTSVVEPTESAGVRPAKSTGTESANTTAMSKSTARMA
jgi:hypothetical protein